MIPSKDMKTPPKKPILTICSSASFYRQAVELEEQLEELGVTVILPDSALVMKKSNDYDLNHYKTWYNNPLMITLRRPG
jgi:hypothetical protein